MRHRYQCPLRWSDMDVFGHVNNVVFLRYLEEARIDFMFRPASADGTGFASGSVVARHEIDYLRPLVHRHQPVTVDLWVTRIAGASATLAYEVKDPGEGPGDPGTVYARALTVVVPYLLDESRPRRLSAQERAFLERYLEPGAPGGKPSGAVAA